MIKTVVKRNGSSVPYDRRRIYNAIRGANSDVNNIMTSDDINNMVSIVEDKIKDLSNVTVEDIQDEVERTLLYNGFIDVGIEYVRYRQKHQIRRNASNNLLKSFKDLLFTDASDSDLKRDNANIDGNAPMGIMLKVGTEATKCWATYFEQPDRFAKAHKDGWIHMHDLDFSYITFNCLQIDLLKVFHNGFTIGSGFIREPNSIRSYAALGCIVIQSSQNDCFGGQSINAFDYAMAEGIRKTFITGVEDALYYHCIYEGLITEGKNPFHKKFTGDPNIRYTEDPIKNKELYDISIDTIMKRFGEVIDDDTISESVTKKIYSIAKKYTENETYQAMEAVIHNLNTMHSRAGSQVPFSSLNYGMDTSCEGRLAIRAILKAIWEGLGNGETPIFPISVFQLKSGVNLNKEDPNYDLFKYSMKVSAKRLFPNYTNLDSSFNSPYYKDGDYNSYVATMG